MLARLMVAFSLILATSAVGIADELPLLIEEDFSNGADRWEPQGESQWTIIEQEGDEKYRAEGKGSYHPPHRSPKHISLLKDILVSDFVLTADLQSTREDYGHRDLCLFFNFVDPAHFYYVHLGLKTDPASNQIMIVDGAERKPITTKKSPGTKWTDDWHKVKIVRRTADGTIEVYFDDMETPAMTAQDKTFTSGRIGLGTFDDHGNWDNIVLRGKKSE